MASLLVLTSQGDVATITDDAYLNRTLQLMNPQQLYELWERQQWQSQGIDLERDKEQWAELDEESKEEHLWGLSSFFVGEERVTTQFSGLVMAYEDEQEEAFLTTQQVDEARHMQFFDRWFREVAGVGGDIRQRLASSREDVTDAFVELFDERLVKMGEKLIADPSDMETKVDFVTTYHMVIEGTLGITASHFLLDLLTERDVLPGFVDGYSRIAADEQRHIAYGTEFLQRAVRDDPAMVDVIRARLVDLLPAVAESVSPPSEGAWDVLGVEEGALASYGLNALTRRLKVIGVSLAPAA